MSAPNEASPLHTANDDDPCKPIRESMGRGKMRGLIDVMFGGAVLTLLLVWLALSIAGRQLT
jgi:hypothetical protein